MKVPPSIYCFKFDAIGWVSVVLLLLLAGAFFTGNGLFIAIAGAAFVSALSATVIVSARTPD